MPESPFMNKVREKIRVRGYSYSTEKTYSEWIVRFIRFLGKRHTDEMAEAEVEAFLTDLAVRRHVSPSTQNQALNALVFLYRHVLDRELVGLEAVRAKPSQRVLIVLTVDEVRLLLAQLSGVHWLAAALLYGSGLRLSECIHLRIKDVDFDHQAIFVRDRKGRKDRVVTLSNTLIAPL